MCSHTLIFAAFSEGFREKIRLFLSRKRKNPLFFEGLFGVGTFITLS